MSATKRINTGDYNIDTFKYNGNPSGNVVMTTHTLLIDGNVVVLGNTTNVQAYDTTLSIFHVNYTQTSPVAGYSGLENVRGGGVNANVGIYWDETGPFTGQWIANNAVGDVGPILTSYNTIIKKTTNAPLGQDEFVVVTGANAAGGGTGLFVNAGTTSSELVSTLTAKKYGIIFG
jgi:hypothetical protein